MLKAFLNSPYLNLFCAVILLITSGYETWRTLDEQLLGVHHGILIVSIVQLLKVLPEFMHNLEEVENIKDDITRIKNDFQNP